MRYEVNINIYELLINIWDDTLYYVLNVRINVGELNYFPNTNIY